MHRLPCGTKFLREFNFADWRFSVFCGNLFSRLGQTGFSCEELIFAIFTKYPISSIGNIFVFIEYLQHAEIHIFKQYYNKTSISLYTSLFLNERDML